MSKTINRLITELVDDAMLDMKKLKKAELQEITKQLLSDNLRELTNDTIVSIYEQRYHTNIAGV